MIDFVPLPHDHFHCHKCGQTFGKNDAEWCWGAYFHLGCPSRKKGPPHADAIDGLERGKCGCCPSDEELGR